MKKLLIAAALVITLGSAPHAFAITEQDCKDQGGIYTSGQCVSGPTDSVAPGEEPGTPATTNASSNGFVPLTSVPAFQQIANGGANGLSGFLNQLYVLCVGASALLAVVIITYAGVEYSLGDSVTEKRNARQRITMALLGLVLVLSPTIVFGIINPNILSLKIDTSTLAPGGTIPTPSKNTPTIPNDPCPQGNASASGKCGDVIIPKDKPFTLMFTEPETPSPDACYITYYAGFSDAATCQAALTKAEAGFAQKGEEAGPLAGNYYINVACLDVGDQFPTYAPTTFCKNSPQPYTP
jgi:hypothetical protein